MVTGIFKVVLEDFTTVRDTKVNLQIKNKYGRSGFDMVEFGEQLRRAREAKGMTQQSLAEQLYVTRQSVSRWECGDRYPDLLTTRKISQILEVSLDDLLSGKEMTKVVERNPVVENKVVNNIIILLYAAVVLSYLIAGVGVTARVLASGSFEVVPIQIIQLIGICVSIVAFVYGLVSVINGNLSPKRMGAVLVAYFVSSFIADADRYYDMMFLSGVNFSSFRTWRILAFVIVIFMMPTLLGAFASFSFFVRSQNRRIWGLLIAAVSLWGIFQALYSLGISVFIAKQHVELIDQLFSVEYYSIKAVLVISIYVLVLYQTYTLYKKRVAAAEVAQVAVDAN